MVGSGELVPHVGAEFGLTDVRRAHGQLQATATTGKLTLEPGSLIDVTPGCPADAVFDAAPVNSCSVAAGGVPAIDVA